MATGKAGKNRKVTGKLLAVYAAVALVFWGYWEGCRNREEGKDMAFQSITQEEAKTRMDTEEGIVILDVRTLEEYEDGHIRGAVCIPNEEIVEAPEELTDKSQTILVYCRSGKRSKQAAEKLAALGYENVLEFGGILDWPYPELVE